MKTLAKISLAIFLGSTTIVNAMDSEGWASIYESLAAFENRAGGNPAIFNRPGYVKPIINNLGNVLNSNWYASANVPQSFVFEAGLPISLIPIGSDDKTFNENGFQVPTIFGAHGDPTIYGDPTVYGSETLNGLGVFTYPYLQLAASFYHARLAFRGMWLPAISELQKFSLFGFGLQYSFGYLFQPSLPPLARGLDVSLVFGYSTSSIGYQPEDYKGSLDLDISAFTIDVVLGYKPFSFFEVMMTLGYQYANMESGGNLICEALNPDRTPSQYYGQALTPNISVKGNNGFKFGLEIAFQLGTSFHPVVGFDYAGKTSFTTNVLYFKQQFGEDKPIESKKEEQNSDEESQSKANEINESDASENDSDNAEANNTDSDSNDTNSESSADESSDSNDFEE